MDFKQFHEEIEPAQLDRSMLAESHMPFCVTGKPQRQEGEYKGTPTVQFLTDIIFVDENGLRQSTNVFLPGSKLFQNYMAGIEKHPEFRHNVYLFMNGKAYDIGQTNGVCPCKHGTNGNQPASSVSRETREKDVVEDFDFFTEEGEGVKFSTAPGSATAEQLERLYKSVLPLAKLGVKLMAPEEIAKLSQKEVEDKILTYAEIAYGMAKA